MLALKPSKLFNIQLLVLLLMMVLMVRLTRIMASGGSAGFVTKRLAHHSNWPLPLNDDEFGESSDVSLLSPVHGISVSGRAAMHRHKDTEQRYPWRYHPHLAKPRLFWHKFPFPQQQDEGEMPTSTEAPPAPMEPEEPVDDEPTTSAPIVTTTTTPEEPEPTTTTTTTTAVTIDTSTPSTTFSTIMRPPIIYKPQLGHKLKNWLFGSPVELNLLQRKKQHQQHQQQLLHSAGGNQTEQTRVRTKSKGFLSLFEVIKFENSKCTVTVGDIRTMEGVCYHDFECKSLGGIATERCAEGVGVCCVFLTGCGEATNQPIVYFESPNYPNAVRDAMICVLTVNLRPNVQQLRLDLLMFELSRPANGDCIDDQFVVSGYNANFAVPVLCGINTGQHIYVHAGDSFERKIYLSFFTRAAVGGRSFNIKVTQLESDLAPDGCLQYYTESEGVLRSFNYDLVGTIVDVQSPTYLNNLNYVICVARAKDTCSVLYKVEQLNEAEELADFQIVNKDSDENDIVGDGQAGAGIFNCPDDFVGVNVVRLCGERFNDGSIIEDYTLHAPIRDIGPGPIVLPFRSDSQYVGRGFRFVYKQEACGNIAAIT